MVIEPRRFPVGLTVAVAIAFAILVGLGTWQVQRLRWKEGLLARVAALQAAPARPAEGVLIAVAAGINADFTRVSLTCPGLAKAPFVELYFLHEGQAGVRLISACRIEGNPRYGSILVDRGFVADTVSARPPVDPADTTPAEVTGVLRMPEHGNLFSPPNTARAWYTRDAAGMAAALQAPRPAPLFLMAESRTNPEWDALRPIAVPVDIPNNHFSYALTWYGLAAALLGVYAAMLFRRRAS
jgi:surfeit locus 1 family protein